MPVAAKAFFVVTAGLLPEEPMPEHTRQWGYTSIDYEADRAAAGFDSTLFAKRRTEALDYARGLMDPRAVNWVRMEFVWL